VQANPGEGMEPIADARQEAGLEIQKLAEDFEKEDEAAFRRTRIACWVIASVVTIIILGMIPLGGDARYLGIFWLIIVGLTGPATRSPAVASGSRRTA
jgi:hypothetical protein